MVIISREMTVSLPEEKLQKVKLQCLDLYQPKSVNFTVANFTVNNPGCPSNTTEQSLPPTAADSSLVRKEVLSGKHNFEQELETGTSMMDKNFGDFQ